MRANDALTPTDEPAEVFEGIWDLLVFVLLVWVTSLIIAIVAGTWLLLRRGRRTEGQEAKG